MAGKVRPISMPTGGTFKFAPEPVKWARCKIDFDTARAEPQKQYFTGESKRKNRPGRRQHRHYWR